MLSWRMNKWVKAWATVISGLIIISGLTLTRGALAEAEIAEPRVALPGYEDTVWGVTAPDGSAASGYTWEMYWEEARERGKNGVSVRINGFEVAFPDQKPVIIEGRVLIPMRPVFEHSQVQCRVDWDAEANQASIRDQKGRLTIIRPGEAGFITILTDGREKVYPLDVPATILNGRVLLPLRALLEVFEFRVLWYDVEQLVDVQDTHPVWRKLVSPDAWKKAQEEDCVPCALVKEAAR